MDRTAHFNTMYAGHGLEPVVEDGPVPCWRLTHPSTDAHDVFVTATPKGVVIQCQEQRSGRTSDVPLSDFVGELTPDYLARKFLKRVWTRASAEECFEALIQKLDRLGIDAMNDDATEMAAALRQKRDRSVTMFDSAGDWQRELAQEIRSMVQGIGWFDDPLVRVSDTRPELGYPDEDVARLVAIHGRFRELFMATYRLVDGVPVRRSL